MSGAKSRRKGANGEREAAKWLERACGWKFEKSSRAGVPGASDVLSKRYGTEDPIHIEVKNCADGSMKLLDASWHAAIEQAERDADGKPWLLVWKTGKKSRNGPERWAATRIRPRLQAIETTHSPVLVKWWVEAMLLLEESKA